MLAHEYGWAKNEILETVYLDELFELSKLITRRKLNDQLMELAIVTNPHVKDPKKLWRTLEEQQRQNEGKDYLDAEFDEAEFDRFKQLLQSKGGGIVVK